MSSHRPTAPSGGRPKRRLQAAQRREVIEQAAASVFAARGYHGSTIDEIAAQAGVTAPVVYDHFGSKLDLHRRLLERTRDELIEMWRSTLGTDEPSAERIARAVDAWARYVQDHPYAPRMYFQETTGVPEVQALHHELQAQARVALGAIVGRARGIDSPADPEQQQGLEMEAELIRSGLTGLALWWSDHPTVSRERIVRTAVDTIWIGLERVRRGEAWKGWLPE